LSIIFYSNELMATFAEHKKILKDIQAFKPQLEKVVDAMGVLAANHFTTSFRNQGFTDENLQMWQPRKRTERSRMGNRAILVKTGRLRRSIRSKRFGFLAVKILTDVPYASVHNNGERSGRGRGFKMPKRQFIGYSGVLNRKIIAKMDVTIKRIFNK
jgi:phage gpG-like protein